MGTRTLRSSDKVTKSNKKSDAGGDDEEADGNYHLQSNKNVASSTSRQNRRNPARHLTSSPVNQDGRLF
jgi:hypothetical protein